MSDEVKPPERVTFQLEPPIQGHGYTGRVVIYETGHPVDYVRADLLDVERAKLADALVETQASAAIAKGRGIRLADAEAKLAEVTKERDRAVWLLAHCTDNSHPDINEFLEARVAKKGGGT